VKLIDLVASNNANIFLEKRSILNQIPNFIRVSIMNNINKYQNEVRNADPLLVCYGPNSWFKLKNLKTIHISYLRNNWNDPNNNNDFNYFLHCRKSTSSVRLRDFQYKLLHNITSTRNKLFKFKYIQDDSCLSCSEENVIIKDNINHSFYNCPKSTNTWINFEKACRDILNVEIELNLENCVKAFKTRNSILNETAISIKKYLHCPMSIRKTVSYEQILKIIDNVKKLRKFKYK